VSLEERRIGGKGPDGGGGGVGNGNGATTCTAASHLPGAVSICRRSSPKGVRKRATPSIFLGFDNKFHMTSTEERRMGVSFPSPTPSSPSRGWEWGWGCRSTVIERQFTS